MPASGIGSPSFHTAGNPSQEWSSYTSQCINSIDITVLALMTEQPAFRGCPLTAGSELSWGSSPPHPTQEDTNAWDFGTLCVYTGRVAETELKQKHTPTSASFVSNNPLGFNSSSAEHQNLLTAEPKWRQPAEAPRHHSTALCCTAEPPELPFSHRIPKALSVSVCFLFRWMPVPLPQPHAAPGWAPQPPHLLLLPLLTPMHSHHHSNNSAHNSSPGGKQWNALA